MDIPEELYLKIFKYVPVLAVDAVVLKEEKILLGKRSIEPYLGKWCLPGGRMDINETCEEAVLREVKEETGLICKINKLIGVYSKPGRDPRGHTVSIAYLLDSASGELVSNFETSELKFFALDEVPENLGFDHELIIKDTLIAISF